MDTATERSERITATEARVHFGEIYRRVTEGDETIVIERNGTPGAVILSIETYERLRQPQEEYRRPYWLENALRLGQAIAAEREGRKPIDWDALIDEGRDEDE